MQYVGSLLCVVVVLLAAMPSPATVRVEQEAGLVRVFTGPMQFELDTNTGTLRSLSVGREHLVSGNSTPLIVASVLESESYDGVRDHAPGERVSADYQFERLDHSHDNDTFTATLTGALDFGNGDALPFTLRLETSAGQAQLLTSLQLKREGLFENRYLHEVALRLPLALHPRKRVAQGGDQGMSWDTRYFYQFHTGMRPTLLKEPEYNEWRLFAVDQDTSNHFSIWRSESDSTAPLTMHHGGTAPGWTAVYDQAKGMLFAYREMAARSPKSLRVQAWEGGEARVLLHPPNAPAVHPNAEGAQSNLFGAVHEVDWLFFEGEYQDVEPQRELAQQWGVDRLASDPPMRPDEARLDTAFELWNAPEALGGRSPMVVGGMPLPRGAVTDPDHVALVADEHAVSLQTDVLAYWPDDSIKWLQLTFPLDSDRPKRAPRAVGRSEQVDFNVTLRGGERRPFTLHYGDSVQRDAPRERVTAEQRGEAVRIDTGPLTLTLAVGERWLRDVSLNGRSILRDSADGQPLAAVDFLRSAEGYPTRTAHVQGEPDPGPVVIKQIALEESGPLRTVVRLEGEARSREPARVILRVEAYADRPWVRLTHSVEFRHKDPREAVLRQMALSLPLALESESARITVGGQDGPMAIDHANRAGLRQLSHLHYDAWRQTDGAPEVLEQRRRSRGWVDLADARGGVTAVIRGMWQQAPKALTADRRSPRLTLGLWPESVPVMDVRRYSNYPHRSQGETVEDDNAWVRETYYEEDPFVGIAKTHDVLLHFHGPDLAPTDLDAIAADFQSRPLVYAGEAWYRQTGVDLPRPDPARFPKAMANLDNAVDFWLHNQQVYGWYGMWDYGDLRHFMNRGYGWRVSADALAEILSQPQKEWDGTTVSREAWRLDYHPQHNWASDNGRWGWANTEGLPGMFLQRAYLRTGRRDVFFAAEAMAHHVRDVVIRHHGKWLGRGTRHGVQHWSDGHHSMRQTVPAEYRMHYYLTGDPRTREVVQRLAERVWLKPGQRVLRHEDHGAVFHGLMMCWEMTGDDAFRTILESYADAFIVPEGIATYLPMTFPEAALDGEPQTINSPEMFFHTFGGMHALLEYQYLTEDEDLRDALIRMARHLIKDDEVRDRWMGKGISYAAPVWKVVAFAARHAEEPTPYRTFLASWVEEAGWPYLFQLFSENPAHWVGPTAFVRGHHIPEAKFWLNGMPYMLTALDAEPDLTTSQRREIEAREREGVTREAVQESWQSQYDDRRFDPYLKRWFPWKDTP